MKKISSILLILITMVSCCFLTACKDKYSKLEMAFESMIGETLESVDLIIDEDKDLGYMDLGVRFSGIKKKNIGEIVVESMPAGLVTVSNYSTVGSLCTFRVTANAASDSEDTKLIVKHMSSNKTSSIDLNIDQKSKYISVDNSKYVVDISNKESRFIEFNKMITMYPTGSTDKIQFALKEGESLPAGINLIKRDETDTYYSGVSIGEECGTGSVKIYPITTMENYEDTKYEDKTLTLHFIDCIDEISLVSKETAQNVDKYSGYGTQDSPVYLLANGADSDVDLRSYMVGVQYPDGDGSADIGGYLEYYSVNSSCDQTNAESNNIMTNVIADGVVAIGATAYTNTEVPVNVSIVPNGYVGEISIVSKTIYVKGVMRPDTIKLYNDEGEIGYTTDGNNIRNYTMEVYTYYEDSTLGKKFTFSSATYGDSPVLDRMDKMQFEIDVDIIANNGNIYTGNTFTEKNTATQYLIESGPNRGDTKTIGNSRYLLDFHFETDERVRFYWDGTKMVSEPIDNDSKIYIIVDTPATNTDKVNRDLGFQVSTINEYGVDELGYKYLATAQNKRIKVAVNKLDGVKDLDVFAAAGNDGSYEVIKDLATDQPKATTKVYINRNHTPKLAAVDYQYYYLYLSNVSAKDLNGNTINNIKLDLSMTADSEKNNPLKLNNGITLSNAGNVNHGTDTYIKLIYDDTTDVGEYTITFTQGGSGFSKDVVVYVYDSITNEGLGDLIALATDDKFFKNNNGKYDAYLSATDPMLAPEEPPVAPDGGDPIVLAVEPSLLNDVYIVNSGRAFDLEIALTDSLVESKKMGFIEGYSFAYDIMKYNGTFESAEIINKDQYFSCPHASSEDNFVPISFKHGTYIGGIRFIKLIATVSVKTYVDILTQGESEPISCEIYFFVYDEILDTDLTLDKDSATVYANEYLGTFDKQDSEITLDIGLNDSLWYYTQYQNVDKKTKWDISSNKVEYTTTDRHGEFTFKGDIYPLYQVDITASIVQFGRTISKTCRVTVKRPIISEKIILNSHSYEDMNGQSYIYMKLGENNPYEVKVSNYSPFGVVTNPGIEMMVVDEMNVPSDQFVLSGHNVSAKIDADPGDYYLIIFARDALKVVPSIEHGGYDHPEDFIMEGIGAGEENQYKNAFFRLKISLADGSEEHPYLIHTAEDFKNIEGEYHYKLMNNINISSLENFSGISEFYGHILTEGEVRTIGGITLNNARPNLIGIFGGTMSNIMFQAELGYVNYSGNNTYLGVIGRNVGTLTNVYANITGSAIADSEVYLGGLVGLNTIDQDTGVSGKISYDDTTRVGVNVRVKLAGNIYFGGLVGLNETTIEGVEKEVDNPTDINFGISLGDQGALANIHITTETALKSIGGVVGKNKGSLSDAYVTGIITAESTDNVGGAIGINEYYVGQDTIKVQLLKDSISSIELASGCEYKVNNISSTVRLSADENVGGIIGYNNSAVITECHYQVVPTILELNTSNKSVAITGNNKVGGIVGYTKNGLISYSSVYSYWWDYTKLGDITDKKYDISGTTNVAGLVGLAESENDDILASKDYDKLSAIIYSSVNGYIAGHGLANNDGYELAIFNAYSMGSTQIELKGNINRNVYLKNSVNSNVSANGVINSDAGNILSGEIPYFGDSTLTHWGDKNTLNGGYIYVSRDDDAVLSDNDPLFEVAPTEITAEVKDDYRIDTSLDKLLVLNYYDFNSSDIDIEVLNELNNSYNTHDILEYVRLGYPLDLGGVRLYVESEDPSIASIQSAGKIRINGTGRTKLTFISVLNPAIRAEIDVIVVTPIGDYEVSDNLNDPYMDSLSIAKDKSKMLYSYTSGIKPYLREDYAYTTNTKPYLDIAISGPAGVVISDYLAISGNKEFANNIQLANTLPFTITVLNIFEGAQFSFVVKPYTLLTYKGIPCKIYSSIYEEDNEYDEFDLTIGNGATGISLNYSGALLYPADRTIITAYLETDMPLFGTTDYTGAKEKLLKSIKVGDTDVSKMINVVAIGALDNGVRPIIFELVIDENVLNFSQGMSTIELILKAGENEDITASAVFDVLPQRIEKIDIKNYARDNLTSPWELTDMIKPASTTDPNGSLLMIDMVPINAYFDYLEIRDITGSELIKFIQVKNEDLEALDIKYTDDGLGIRLEPQGMDTIYVHMQIESSYTTKVHTLEVTAYVNGSDSIVYNLYQETKQVEAKMLPEIKPTYVLPNGDEKIIENGGSIYLACGTDAELRILVEDATEPMTHTLTYADGTELVDYEFVHDQGLFYILKYVGNPANRANLMGKTITLTLTAVSEEENGEFEEITYVISFVLVEYQIHSISVSPSMNNEIYGLFNRSVDLSFYLAATDISYYGRLAANTEYRHTDDRTHVGTGSVLESIYNILDTLNSTAQEPSQLVSSNENIAELAISNERLTLKVSKEKRDSNGVLISQYTGEEYLTLTLPLELDADGKKWVIARGTALYTIGEEYGLNFIDPSSKKEPIIITSEKEFIEMASGPNTYYALGKDLEFDDYVPLNVNVTEFDGNGHIITIRGFMDSESADVKLGVFAEIPKGMLVKNLTVYYPEDSIGRISGSGSNISISYKDLTDNEVVNYSTVNFGGLAGVNNGIITNCNVQGTIAIHASVLETRGTAMNIGGLVATNTSTGYITHSNTELNIYSQSNIGGLVYENAGTIASSYNKNAKIYAYNKNLTSSIIVQVAGFVAKNSGDISMSYIKLDRDHVMRAKDVSGGFVLTNTGTIVDSYSEIDEISYTTNSNYFSGFVDNNSGTIERAYTYINAGNREDNNLFMFIRTGQNSGELIDCIEIVNSANYSSTEEGLDNVKYSESRTKFIDKGYSFGNNLNMNSGAVWAFEFGLPRLSSTKEVVKPIVDPDGEGMEYVGRYIIYQKVVVETEDGEETKYVEYNSNYGSKDNPFVIHDINSWNEYMMDYAIGGVNTNYFRIVSDIDFSSEKDNPKTSTLTFAGNIQGNNMTLSNIILKSNESLSSIGLFETMESRDGIVDTQVRNMTLNASSVWATKTQTVGILAGVIENFDLYNINIDAENITIVGGNAVGGLAGIVRGSFDIDKISSNVGVNSTRVVATNQHHIYSSVNNQGEKSNNIANVYYAGSVAGILDGYDSYIDFDISSARIIDEVDRRINNYYQARNISVSGSMVLIGDIVGSAFGLIGERVQIDNVKTALNNASLTGSQYSSGLVGENRGVIVRSSAKLVGDHSYDLATGSMAGLVGLNLGGLVHSSSFEGNIINNQRKAVVGGIVGRNINGTIFDVNVSGNLAGHFLGGIVGADYTKDTLVAHGSGYGALVNTCKGDSLIPSDVEYKESNSGLNKFVDLKISSGTLEYMLKNIKSYYTYRIDTSENGGNPTHTLVQTRHKVLGLAIGMSDITGQINSIAKQDGSIVLNKGENWVSAEGIYVEVSAVDGLLAIDGSEKDNIDLVSNDQVNKNILSQLSSADLSPVYQVYLTGTIVSTFDSWAGLYSKEDMLILGNLTIKTPTPPAS